MKVLNSLLTISDLFLFTRTIKIHLSNCLVSSYLLEMVMPSKKSSESYYTPSEILEPTWVAGVTGNMYTIPILASFYTIPIIPKQAVIALWHSTSISQRHQMLVHKSGWHIALLTNFPNVLSLLMEIYISMPQEHFQKRLGELKSKVCMH